MNDWERHAVLLDLIGGLNDAGSWTGETHVQKCAYFLEAGLEVPLDLDFILYKHGPYSFDLADLIGELRGKLLVALERTPAPYGPKLIVSQSGTALVGRFPRIVGKFHEPIEFVSKSLGLRNVKELERVANRVVCDTAVRWLRRRSRSEAGSTQAACCPPQTPGQRSSSWTRC